MTRRNFIPAAPLVLSSCTGIPPMTQVRIAANSLDTVSQLPLLLARELGYFKERGIEAAIEPVAAGSRVMQALLSGSAEVGCTFFDQAAALAAEGRDVISFFVITRYPNLVLAVSPASKRKIQTIADLKGAVAGVTAPGSPTHYQLNYLLAKHGVAPADVSVVGLGSNAARLAALEAGRVDAAVLGDPGATILRMRHPKLVTLMDTRTPAGTLAAFGTAVYPGAVLLATRRWLNDHASAARNISLSLRHAMRWIQDTPPEKVVDRIPAEHRQDPRVYVMALRHLPAALSPDGAMTAEAAATVIRVLSASDARIAAKKVDPASTYSNEFLP